MPKPKLTVICLDCKKSKEANYEEYPEENEPMLIGMIDWIRENHNGHRIKIEETGLDIPRNLIEVIKGRK